MERQSNYEFEPFCKWQKEEGRDILEVHLEGFKKEQLRVQVNSMGILTVSGERPWDEHINSRFRKEIKISNDFNTNEIRAKFSAGVLYVTIPKKIQQVQENGKANPQINQDKVSKNPTSNEMGRATEKIPATEDASATMGGSGGRVQLTKFKFGVKSSVSRLKMSRRMAVIVVAVVVVVVALGSYFTYTYKYRSSRDEM